MKKLLMIVLPLLLIGGVIGAAMMGLINIPGLTPAKADWKATLIKTFKAHGTLKGDMVVLKDTSPAEKEAFLAAAKAGALNPVASDAGIKSAKLVAFLKKETKPSAPPKSTLVKAPPVLPPVVHPTKKLLPTNKPEQGAEAVAELWNEIDVSKLLKITEKYKDPELAKILLKMEPEHVAELLTALKPEKAAALSRELQKQASAG